MIDLICLKSNSDMLCAGDVELVTIGAVTDSIDGFFFNYTEPYPYSFIWPGVYNYSEWLAYRYRD